MQLHLNTHGVSLNVENGLFVINHKDGKQRIEPSKIESIYVSKGISITSDAIFLALQNEIDIIFLDKIGEPQGRIWSHKFGSISTIRIKQVEFVFSKKAVEWIKELIMKKIDNQCALLYALAAKKYGDEYNKNAELIKTINSLTDYKQKIKDLEGENVADIAPKLRGWEGISTKRYFALISAMLPAEYQFVERSQHPAYDPFNCLLNYGYGLLYSKIEGALIKAGVDPYLGVFHRENYNRPALAFDVIEIFRIWIDFVVCELCIQKVVCDDWFSVNEGVYWLENQGKRILAQCINDYLEDTIEYKNRNISRLFYLETYCRELANMFVNFKG